MHIKEIPMSKLAHTEKVKEVAVLNEDVLCIELLSGVRLMGPLRTNPVPRQPVVREPAAPDFATALPAA
jgi:hypothetical protein